MSLWWETDEDELEATDMDGGRGPLDSSKLEQG